jgi:4-hydroxy-tetrahydrodipicolinate synthase
MLTAASLKGLLPAVPSLVHADGTTDTGAMRALVEFLLKNGVDGIVPLGGTGEYGSLARAERYKLAQTVVHAVGGKVPVVAGILDPGFHDALESGRALADAGADALMVVTPYYTNPTQAGVRDYFLRYADAAPVPIVIYEIPYRTRVAITPAVLHELSRHERIIGMKACNTDMYHFLQVVAGVDRSFAVLSGEDTLFPLHVAAGARGGIVVTANLVPRAWRRVFDPAVSGRLGEALVVHRHLIPLMNMAFAETNPGPLKSVLDVIGIDAPHLLAPLVPPAADLTTRLRAEVVRQRQAFEAA